MKLLLIAVAPAVLTVGLLLGVVVVLGGGRPAFSHGSADYCLPRLPNAVKDLDLSSEQWSSARSVVTVGRSNDVPSRGWVIAVATALQESTLRPLPYGDRDSLGLFQQRSAWGTTRARMDPEESARMFYTGGRAGQPGLLDIDGWTKMGVAQAAQAVQRSAFPDAYARWGPMAEAIVSKVANDAVSCVVNDTWVSPLRADSFVFTAGFGDCGRYWSACHTGLDFAAATGTPVMATASGTITYSGDGGAYGNLVRVLHPNGIATWYGHLDTRLVSSGTRVRPGDVIGLVGATGNTTGPHLHLEVRAEATETDPGTPIDPQGWLEQHQALP